MAMQRRYAATPAPAERHRESVVGDIEPDRAEPSAPPTQPKASGGMPAASMSLGANTGKA